MKKAVMFSVIGLLILQAMSQVQLGLSFQPNWSFKNRDINWFNYSISARSSIVLYKNLSVLVGLGYAPEKYDRLGWDIGIDRLMPDLYYFQLIQTELQVSYNFLNNTKTSIYCLGGMLLSTCINVKSEYSIPPPETSIDNSIGINNVYVNIGLGFQYRVKYLAFSIEPLFYYSLKEGNYFKHRIGINFGIYYRFASRALATSTQTQFIPTANK